MRRLWRFVKIALIIGVIAAVGTAIGMRSVADDPAMWHADPALTDRTGKPNDYLVAPSGLSKAEPDRETTVHQLSPEELLFLFDAVARPSSAVLAGSVRDGHITYVQRTALMGFPDYISVKAVEVGGGSALIIWSRSRFGYSDMGVNRKRIDGWLVQIEKPGTE